MGERELFVCTNDIFFTLLLYENDVLAYDAFMANRIFLRIFTLLIFVGLSCGALDTFTVTEKAQATINKGTFVEQLLGDLGFGKLLTLRIMDSQQLKNQGVERHEVDSIFVDTVTLEILDPAAGQDFTFLDSIEFYVETSGQPKRLLAKGSGFASGDIRIGLEVEHFDLAPYATEEAMDITTAVTGRRPTSDTVIEATLDFSVDANVSGALCGP